MELQGRKGLVDTGKSSRTWSVPTVSLGLAVLNQIAGGVVASGPLVVPPPRGFACPHTAGIARMGMCGCTAWSCPCTTLRRSAWQ